MKIDYAILRNEAKMMIFLKERVMNKLMYSLTLPRFEESDLNDVEHFPGVAAFLGIVVPGLAVHTQTE